MINVLLSTAAPNWPWKRQTPSWQGKWKDFNFLIDEPCSEADAWVVFESLESTRTINCPADRIIFVAGEPSTISDYETDFLKQFSHVVISHQKITHHQVIFHHQGHPWFVEKSFDELVTMQPVPKTKGVCVIISNKSYTIGHEKRLKFVEVLQKNLGDRIDVWGRGIRDFDSKWDVLKDYRYAVVLENTIECDYISEKLPDAWLAYCLPFYAGCPNLELYYPQGAYVKLDIDDPEDASRKLNAALENHSIYENAITNITKCRDIYLNGNQFFPNFESIFFSIGNKSECEPRSVMLHPNKHFRTNQANSCLQFGFANYIKRMSRFLKNTKKDQS